MHYKDTDYLHASARAAYLENKLITEDELLKAAGTDSAGEAYRLLAGEKLLKGHSLSEYEKTFEEDLTETWRLVEDMTGNTGLTYVFRYPVDGHNMKVMVKSRLASGDHSELYKDGGTVGIDEMRKEFEKGRFDAVPEILGQAAVEAAAQLAKSGDPQAVDLLIDRAVIRLISKKSEEIDCPVLTEYTMKRIDLINISSGLRLLRAGADPHVASGVFAEGGDFTVKELETSYIAGYEGMKSLVRKIPHSDGMEEAVDMVRQGQCISAFEQQEGRYFRKLFDRARTIPFGAEPVIAFLYLKEREIRAVRFVLTSKFFNMPEEEIAKGVRYLYAD